MKNEKEVEEKVEKILVSRELYPYRVTHTLEFNGILSITFLANTDLEECLEIIEYNTLCDKSTIEVLRETNTLIFHGLAIKYIYKLI